MALCPDERGEGRSVGDTERREEGPLSAQGNCFEREKGERREREGREKGEREKWRKERGIET